MTKKGLNKEKLQEVSESIEKAVNMEGVKEMIKDNKVVDMKVDEVLSVMNETDAVKRVEKDFAEEIQLEKDKKEVEIEMKRENKHVLNREIRKALAFYKEKGVRGVTGKQVKAITDGYKRIIGEEMSDVQIKYIRTLTDEQATGVLNVINAYNKFIREQERAQRMELASNN